MKVADIVGTPPKILLWGDLGTGKSALTMTLGKDLQIIDLDAGLLTGVTLQDQHTAARKAVDVKQFIEKSPHKQATVFNAVKNYVFGVSEECGKGTYPFKYLAVDSLTALAEHAVSFVMGNSGQLGKNPQIQHWGIAFSEIKNVISVLRALPIPVILIGHEQVKTIGEGADQETKLELALSGKNLGSQIARYCDEIWYMRAKPIGGGKMSYCIQTVADGKIPARSRANIPNMTDTKIGMLELMRMIGYVEPKKEEKK